MNRHTVRAALAVAVTLAAMMAALTSGAADTLRVGKAGRDALAVTLNPDLSAMYERQRARGGPGAGPLQGHRCGSCRVEIGRGDLAQITAAAEDEVLRCPECDAILLRVKGFDQ